MPIGKAIKRGLDMGRAMRSQEETQPVERSGPISSSGRTVSAPKPRVPEAQPAARSPRRAAIQAQLGLQAIANRPKPLSKPSVIAAKVRKSLKPGFK